MQVNYVLLVLMVVFAVAIFIIARHPYIVHKKNKEIKKLKKEIVSLGLGKKIELNYLIISDKLHFTATHNPEELNEILILASKRAVEDINSLISYNDLKKYLKDYEKLVSPEMVNIHQAVIKGCDKHVGELFDKELRSIKDMQANSNIKLRSLGVFIEELESLHFINFRYQNGNLNAANKLKTELVKDLTITKEEAPVVIMETQVSDDKTAANK